MYKQIFDFERNVLIGIANLASNTYFPCALDNTDYQRFKKDIEDGAELQDADGKKMTKSKVTAFLKTLP